MAQKKRNNTAFNVLYLLTTFVAVLLIQRACGQVVRSAPIAYSEFEKGLDEGNITEVVISGDEIRGEFKTPVSGQKRFSTRRVDPELAKRLDQANVKYSQQPESMLLPTLLSWVLPLGLFFIIWSFVVRRMGSGGGGLMAIGKSKAKVYVETDTQVTFADVAGAEEAKQELREVVEFLKDPASHGRLGAHMPKGVLLVGPPGTGKTLFARAIAGEAKVPFYSISGSEFVEMFVGVGAARVRDLFEQARKAAPCIIFIDELDALGRARNAQAFGGGHDEKEQTLNQLLVELDGFDSKSGLVLLAATNRPEILDAALLRAGRFDRQIVVDRPDRVGRDAILRVHLKKIHAEPELDVEAIAALTPGFTGADLANLVNEAALFATRRNAEMVVMDDFTRALERIVAGLEKTNRLLNPKEREIVAYHEMGHALVASLIPGIDVVHKVSIIPRGVGALGYTLQRPTEDRFLMTREELENKMAVLLGGRAAEQLVFSHTSTGAADDLAKVTDIARSMVTRYAMVPSLGPVTYDKDPGTFLNQGPLSFEQRKYSESTAREIDVAVRQIVEQAYERVCALLEQHRPLLDSSAKRLMEQETLAGSELLEMLEGESASGAATPLRGAPLS